VRPFGQVDISHVVTGLVTATLLGVGGVVWGLVKPDPDRSVEMALVKRDIADLKAQTQRIEEVVVRLADGQSGTVRPASGKR
jgi:hypothetical protein